MRLALLVVMLLLARAAIAADARRSGTTFLTPETRAMQEDDAQNPGMLWVAEGETLFRRDCTSCHTGAAMRGVGARYPAIDGKSGALLNLENRIRQCQMQEMKRD